MKRITLILATAGLALLLAIPAVHGNDTFLRARGRFGVTGAVYTMTNAPDGNEVLMYKRLANGRLRFASAYATEGLGSGDGLGSQGGVVLSDDGRWLLVVNAGSNEVSVFAVHRGGLALTDVAPSGGVRPVSVAMSKGLVYVLHAGGSADDTDSVTGFGLDGLGRLTLLVGSSRPLSAPDTGPAQIGFTPDGQFLMVTEKATSNVTVFPLDRDGYADAAVVNPSQGMTPFAFSFGKRDQVFISEVFGGAEGGGAVSSYELQEDGTLQLIDGSVPNNETAPCWLVVTRGARYVYTTNTPDDSLSGYAIDFDGHLELLDPDGRTGEPGPGTRPLDMDLSDDGRFLFTLNVGDGTISTFAVRNDGSLDQLHVVGGVPGGVNGLAAR